MRRMILVLMVVAKAFAEEMPLVFADMSDDSTARKVNIYWNPMMKVEEHYVKRRKPAQQVRKVLSLSSAIVHYDVDGSEKHGDWLPMVTESDDDDGSKGYVFLKRQACVEVDWKVCFDSIVDCLLRPAESLSKTPASTSTISDVSKASLTGEHVNTLSYRA